MWWDGEETPSVECPVTDFFGVGHDLATSDLSCEFLYVAPRFGYNSYFKMPFARGCRIELANDGNEEIPGVNSVVEWERYPEAPRTPWRFHAAWRRVMPAYRRGAPLTLLEARGEGRLMGIVYHVCKRDSDDRWSHGGGDQIFIDGETAEPGYVYGVGGEDFAHHAWGLAPGRGPHTGAHLVHPLPGTKPSEGPKGGFEPHGWEQHDSGRYSMYRFFVPDPIHFDHSIRMTFGTAANEISATAYWYQSEPHARFCEIPSRDKRRFGSRITAEETLHPLDIGQDLPAAVLGIFPFARAGRWTPAEEVDLGASYPAVEQPFGNQFRAPFLARWERAGLRGGFLDLSAIYRPKARLRERGLWNYRHIPTGSCACVLLRVKALAPVSVPVTVGFEDTLEVWLNHRVAAAWNRPDPQCWDTERTVLALDAGWNDVVLCATQDRLIRWSAWSIFFRPDPGEDLEFEPFSALPENPERWTEPEAFAEFSNDPNFRDPNHYV